MKRSSVSTLAGLMLAVVGLAPSLAAEGPEKNRDLGGLLDKAAEHLECYARYSNYRRFVVETEEQLRLTPEVKSPLP
jgi:hypothetical protein